MHGCVRRRGIGGTVKKRLMVGLLSAGLVVAMMPGVGLAAKPAPMPGDSIGFYTWWSEGSGSDGLCHSHVDVNYELSSPARWLGARNVFDLTEGEENVSKALRGGQMTIDLVPFDVLDYPLGSPVGVKVALYDAKGILINAQTTMNAYMPLQCPPDGTELAVFDPDI
jgi:hypothetical protein